jgi:hypothetical protein
MGIMLLHYGADGRRKPVRSPERAHQEGKEGVLLRWSFTGIPAEMLIRICLWASVLVSRGREPAGNKSKNMIVR